MDLQDTGMLNIHKVTATLWTVTCILREVSWINWMSSVQQVVHGDATLGSFETIVITVGSSGFSRRF